MHWITLFSIYFALFVSVRNQYVYKYVYDTLGRFEKNKILELSNELIVEAKYKIHQVDGIRDHLASHDSFQYGMLIGEIREKYRAMLELYRMTKNRYTGKTNLAMPAISRRKPLHYIVRMEMIRSMENDIDKLVHILTTSPNFADAAPLMVPKMRAKEDEDSKYEAWKARLEDQVKNGYREKFYQKQLGESGSVNASSIEIEKLVRNARLT